MRRCADNWRTESGSSSSRECSGMPMPSNNVSKMQVHINTSKTGCNSNIGKIPCNSDTSIVYLNSSSEAQLFSNTIRKT